MQNVVSRSDIVYKKNVLAARAIIPLETVGKNLLLTERTLQLVW